MLPRVGATEARVRFGELLHRVVEQGETVVIERTGEPEAVVLSITAYEQMMAALRPEDWRTRLDCAAAVGVGGAPRPSRGNGQGNAGGREWRRAMRSGRTY